MARKTIPRPEVEIPKVYLDGVAKNLVGKLYGPNGPPRGTTFADLEELAVQLGRTISRELLNRALERQAAPLPATPSVDGVGDVGGSDRVGEAGGAADAGDRDGTVR